MALTRRLLRGHEFARQNALSPDRWRCGPARWDRFDWMLVRCKRRKKSTIAGRFIRLPRWLPGIRAKENAACQGRNYFLESGKSSLKTGAPGKTYDTLRTI